MGIAGTFDLIDNAHGNAVGGAGRPSVVISTDFKTALIKMSMNKNWDNWQHREQFKANVLTTLGIISDDDLKITYYYLHGTHRGVLESDVNEFWIRLDNVNISYKTFFNACLLYAYLLTVQREALAYLKVSSVINKIFGNGSVTGIEKILPVSSGYITYDSAGTGLLFKFDASAIYDFVAHRDFLINYMYIRTGTDLNTYTDVEYNLNGVTNQFIVRCMNIANKDSFTKFTVLGDYLKDGFFSVLVAFMTACLDFDLL